MNLTEVLDLAKQARSLATDMALADALRISRSAVSAWRNGHKTPDAVQCAALAEMAGLPLAKVLGIAGEARAISREEKAVWKRLASAAAIVLLVAATPLPAQARDAITRASSGLTSHITAGSAYYVRRWRRFVHALRLMLARRTDARHALLPL